MPGKTGKRKQAMVHADAGRYLELLRKRGAEMRQSWP
jgi:hypothetical protein